MSDLDSLRRNLVAMVEELRYTMKDIGDQGLPTDNVINNARDRLRYISSLTEQSAGQTLNAAEAILDRLHAQRAQAEMLARKTRSPEIRAFLDRLAEEHRLSSAAAGEIIEAQAFQDLVGQVVGKLMLTVQKMEDSLVHLLVEDNKDPNALAGPVTKPEQQVSQEDIDNLFG